MPRYRTDYQQVADQIIAHHPMRTLKWHANRLFWKTPKGWLELVVGSSGTWFRVENQETIAKLEKGTSA